MPSPVDQLRASLAGCLKEHILELPRDPEGKARAVLELTRSLTEAFEAGLKEGLRGEVRPVIRRLLHDISEDYDGKRDRAAAVNGLLSAFGLTIRVQDAQGREPLCSLQAVRGRQSDEKGYLRLLERTRSGSSQKSYPLRPPDELQLIDLPRERHGQQLQPGEHGRGR